MFRSNVHVSEISGLDDSHKETEAISEETVMDNFLKLVKDINPQIQEAL